MYGIIATLICLLTGTMIYFLAYQVVVNNVKQSLMEIAEQGAHRVEDRLNGYLNELETISSIDTIKNPAIPWQEKLRIIELIASRKNSNIKRISIADSHGYSQTSDGSKLIISDRVYFQKAITGQHYVSNPLISRIDGSVVIIFAVPIYYQGHIASILYATHSIEALCQITDDIKMSRKGYSFIINEQGQLIAHHNRNLVYFGNNYFSKIKRNPKLKALVALEKQMIAGKIGAGEYYDGDKKYLGFAPISGTGWSIAITAPKKDIFGRLDQILFYFGLLISLIFLLFSTLYMNNISLQQLLTQEQDFLNNAIDTANIMMIEFDSRGKITWFNQYAEEKLEYTLIEILGHITIYDLVPHEYSDRVTEIIEKTAKKKKSSSRSEFPLTKKAGGTIHILWSINSTQHFPKNAERFTLMGVDITDRVAYERKLLESNRELGVLYKELASSEEEFRRLAYYDPLTGLPNRFSLFEQSTTIISNTIVNYSQGALLYLDIDNFKLINDTFGHSIGDLLLIEIGNRLGVMMNNCEVFRLGGDEFVALITNLPNLADLQKVSTKIVTDFSRPFNIQDHVFHISLSMGITLFPDNGQTIEDLLKNADTAMYRAKESGKNQCIFFDRSMNDSIVKRVEMESDLRLALVNQEFFIVYQPQVRAATGLVVGFEALIRWQSPKYGLVSPLKFIKIAEETGLIIPIGIWVLEHSSSFAAKLQKNGLKEFNVSINISTRQILQNDFVERVQDIIAQSGVSPERIGLELTETALMESFETTLKKLQNIKELGFGIHLDDFGTGYSSLNYLRNLPINVIKIDKSFVDDIHHGNQHPLIATIITLAHQVNLQVIAEGVETKEQLAFLIACDCDMIQGFLFSKPVSEDEALGIARKGSLPLTSS
jgi:diguanylate cyclase (GGDEF)-like protein/PAS domain S-box-containing protein